MNIRDVKYGRIAIEILKTPYCLDFLDDKELSLSIKNNFKYKQQALEAIEECESYIVPYVNGPSNSDREPNRALINYKNYILERLENIKKILKTL